MKKNNNRGRSVQSFPDMGLCHGCGLCAAVCPKGAIKITIHHRTTMNAPEIDDSLCNSCGICSQSCPGLKIDLRHIYKDGVFSGGPFTAIGPYKQIIQIQNNGKKPPGSSSEGFVTRSILKLIQVSDVDGAIVTLPDSKCKIMFNGCLTNELNDICAATGSVYGPVSMEQAFKDLRATSLLRIAFIGLPCHMHALERLKEIDPVSYSKIYIKIGLFCSSGKTHRATENLIKKSGINIGAVSAIRYREGDWPGNLSISCDCGPSPISIPMSDYSSYPEFSVNTPIRCFTCIDWTNFLSDVAVGDTWNIGGDGRSLLIIRSDRGHHLVKRMNESCTFTCKDLAPAELLKTQDNFFLKYAKQKARRKNLKMMGYENPDYSISFGGQSLYDRIGDMIIIIPYVLAEKGCNTLAELGLKMRMRIIDRLLK